MEQVAIWWSNQIRPAEAAERLAEVGWYYNTAMAIIENNAVGAGLLDNFVRTHKYSRIYRKEEWLDSDPSVSDKFGITTTQTGKHLLLVEFQQIWRDNAIILHDYDTIVELCNFVYLKKQNWSPNQILKTGALQGMKDDRVISLLLALHAAMLYLQAPKPKIPKKDLSGLSIDQKQHQRIMKEFMKEIQDDFGKRKEKIEVL